MRWAGILLLGYICLSFTVQMCERLRQFVKIFIRVFIIWLSKIS